MSSANTIILDSVKAALIAAAAGTRVVTRSYRECNQRDDAEVQQGIFTILKAGNPDNSDGLDYMDIVIVGQGMIPEAALKDPAKDPAGEQLDEFEGTLEDEIRVFADGIVGCRAVVMGVRNSMQLETPYCWVTMDVRLGPYRLVSDQLGGDQEPFITYHQTTAIVGSIEDTEAAVDEATLPQ